jgi:SpoVK/Ycf46/Vps4 family AAA+-type ATPase
MFQSVPIEIQYSQPHPPRNANTLIVRFEQFTIRSQKSLQHLLDFTDMIKDFELPDVKLGELSKYTWDVEDLHWAYCQPVRSRKMDTIYLPKKDDIIQSLDSFLNDPEKNELYESLDIPSKQIFLLYGLPGTGKTSLIRALATRFEYNLAIVKNVARMNDQSLEHMMSRFPKRSFLVFEDIDCMFDNRDVKNNTGITYSGLLNLLDGLVQYDKMVIFITTNIIQSLDSSFRRRVDMFIEFDYIRKDQVNEMYTRFFKTSERADEFCNQIKGKKLTANMLEKYFIWCIQKGKSPHESLKQLEDYSTKTREIRSDQLYM